MIETDWAQSLSADIWSKPVPYSRYHVYEQFDMGEYEDRGLWPLFSFRLFCAKIYRKVKDHSM